MQSLRGRCLCDGIQFTVAPPILFVAHCHCHYCRDAHGAAFVTWVGVRAEELRYLAGAELVRWYASSVQSRRGFCSSCGTTLFFMSELCPGEVHIVRTAFPGIADLAPQLHCFYDQRVDWVTAADDLPRYASDQPGLSKFKAVKPRT